MSAVAAKKRINLLPPEEQKEVARLEINAEILHFGIILTASLLVLAAVLFGVNLWLGRTVSKNDQEIAKYSTQLEAYQGTSLQKEVAALNENIENFKMLSEQSMKWSPYLMELATLIPKDVSLDSIQLNRITGKVEVTGRASNRNSVLALRQRVLDSKHFKNINFPLYNLETARNVSWKYRFYLRMEEAEE
ncbi:MAG: hypothetical protein A2751_03380 [Candidatus Doudnabacteria bacterium RIFCSPHIGHO2_01_FULL_46_14]|uniref:Fimbrial assembly protein n=1 Tax=Candidatus Doudnabacteria bacterium RIFCSPHIGHO2_01_FULL_46_14 TaxID=1817824 RepID=A0A1F5NKE7_9BACT|nr:MAG: hypothetical protein A2751_03380 [Candidatus Doudnabacteria bacterium RIFCSPHIGHO2_01_FULL_46_14]